MKATDVVAAFLSDPQANAQYREQLNGRTADQIAKAITHFAFRNGPVEDMHADPNSQLSQQDMRTLNKFMHNRLTYVVQLVADQRWVELAMLLDLHKYSGSDWDPAEPDDGGTRRIITMEYDSYKKQNRRRAAVEPETPRQKSSQVAAARLDANSDNQVPE